MQARLYDNTITNNSEGLVCVCMCVHDYVVGTEINEIQEKPRNPRNPYGSVRIRTDGRTDVKTSGRALLDVWGLGHLSPQL